MPKVIGEKLMKKYHLIGSAFALIMILQFIAGMGLASQPSCCELTLYQYYMNENPLVAYNGIPLEVHALENGTIINQTMQIDSVNYGNVKREISKEDPHYEYDLVYDINNPVWNNTGMVFSFQVPGDMYLMGYGIEFNSTNSAGFILASVWKSRLDEESQLPVPIIDENYDYVHEVAVYNSDIFANISCNVLLDYESTFNGTFFISIEERFGRDAVVNVNYDDMKGDGCDNAFTYDYYIFEEEILEYPYTAYHYGNRLSHLDGVGIDPHFWFKVDTPSHTNYQEGSIEVLDATINGSALPSSGYYSKIIPQPIEGSSINWVFGTNWENFSVDISNLLVNYSRTVTMDITPIESLGAIIGFNYEYVLTVDPLLYGAQLQFRVPKFLNSHHLQTGYR